MRVASDSRGRTHRPDRITNDGKTTRVLDIKTGAPSEEHHDQVAFYVRMLRELGEPHVTGHLLYVRDGRIAEVGDRSLNIIP